MLTVVNSFIYRQTVSIVRCLRCDVKLILVNKLAFPASNDFLSAFWTIIYTNTIITPYRVVISKYLFSEFHLSVLARKRFKTESNKDKVCGNSRLTNFTIQGKPSMFCFFDLQFGRLISQASAINIQNQIERVKHRISGEVSLYMNANAFITRSRESKTKYQNKLHHFFVKAPKQKVCSIKWVI